MCILGKGTLYIYMYVLYIRLNTYIRVPLPGTVYVCTVPGNGTRIYMYIRLNTLSITQVLEGVVGRLANRGLVYSSNPDRLSKFALLQARDNFRHCPPSGPVRRERGRDGGREGGKKGGKKRSKRNRKTGREEDGKQRGKLECRV